MKLVVILAATLFCYTSQSWAIDKDSVDKINHDLGEILQSDQLTRNEIVEKRKELKPTDPHITALWKKQNEIDTENQKYVTWLLDSYGWPKKEDFNGSTASETVFLVIQHANHEYQRKYFEVAKIAANSGELKKSSFALLQDRFLVGEGKKQLYGSQVMIDQETGKREFYPIEDEKNVDRRRVEVGLQPLVEYAKYFNIEYKPKIPE